MSKGQEILKLKQEGYNRTQIAKSLNCSRSLINYYCEKYHVKSDAVRKISDDNKKQFNDLIEAGYSQREIAKELNVAQGTIKYWLRKLDLKTKLKKGGQQILYIDKHSKQCGKCKEIKTNDCFYKQSKNGLFQGICKKCSNKHTVERVRIIKIKMINYKGGKCNNCSLKLEETHPNVFEFHHLDRRNKDINFNKIKSRNWEYIKNEIDKCELLCANCHRLAHAYTEYK